MGEHKAQCGRGKEGVLTKFTRVQDVCAMLSDLLKGTASLMRHNTVRT